MNIIALSFALVAAAAPFAARAADIYVWTDESGKTHLADSVPAKYQKSAVRIDSSQFELTPKQQRDAAAARLRAREEGGRRVGAAPASAARPAPPRTAGPLSAPPASEPPAVESSECEALQREYRESLECFAPFVNANGSLKPGAFAACKSVVNPTLKCGSPKSY